MSESKTPAVYDAFVARYPALAKAWEGTAEAGKDGPLDDKTARLVKLGIAMGAAREGAVHSGTRKALALGITREEIEQVVALCAGTCGFPQTVAAFSWVRDELEK